MKRITAFILLVATAVFGSLALAQEPGHAAPPRHITVQKLSFMALEHNHNIRIAGDRKRSTRNNTRQKPHGAHISHP